MHLGLSLISETSPHTRGEHMTDIYTNDRLRNIPAYAGRTDAHLPEDGSLQKHPRIRGENTDIHKTKDVTMETSPHTRGERIGHGTTKERRRNIPAYAGRTGFRLGRGRQCGKHPRIRGENLCITRTAAGIAETSPHTRGERERP